VSPNGNYLASGDEDGNLAVWNTKTSKILRKYALPNKVVDNVSWAPSDSPYCLLLCANEEQVHIFAPALYSHDVNASTRTAFESCKKSYALDKAANDKKEQFCKWDWLKDYRGEPMVTLTLKNVVSRLVWHAKGDYFATMAHNVQ